MSVLKGTSTVPEKLAITVCITFLHAHYFPACSDFLNIMWQKKNQHFFLKISYSRKKVKRAFTPDLLLPQNSKKNKMSMLIGFVLKNGFIVVFLLEL